MCLPDTEFTRPVSAAVASGVMSLDGGVFQLLRAVSGAEALDVTARLEALTRP